MPAKEVVNHIVEQIERLHDELSRYEPTSMDWAGRAKASAERLIPWLVDSAPEHRQFVQDALNAPC